MLLKLNLFSFLLTDSEFHPKKLACLIKSSDLPKSNPDLGSSFIEISNLSTSDMITTKPIVPEFNLIVNNNSRKHQNTSHHSFIISNSIKQPTSHVLSCSTKSSQIENGDNDAQDEAQDLSVHNRRNKLASNDKKIEYQNLSSQPLSVNVRNDCYLFIYLFFNVFSLT